MTTNASGTTPVPTEDEYLRAIGGFVKAFSTAEFTLKRTFADALPRGKNVAYMLMLNMDVSKIITAGLMIIADLDDHEMSKDQKKRWEKIIKSLRTLNNHRNDLLHGTIRHNKFGDDFTGGPLHVMRLRTGSSTFARLFGHIKEIDALTTQLNTLSMQMIDALQAYKKEADEIFERFEQEAAGEG
jgi:hypothetical protein